MRFEPGINCVVGPNGSGKSNVVDALAWVMGEQGVKNLRGGSMADVIFAGTTKRAALGRAEVSLTIDNSDGALPIEYSEVTISRTLFRSGGSEYAINGTDCRLLDIQELLSDTGMGREMHVIIGQGRLDQVLTATPEDRRSFIEEAAGVLKHRRRKERAVRKLESMAVDFTRVEDLAAELRRQLGPLAKQAEAARRAQIIQADERDARARLLADDLAQVQAQLLAKTHDEKRIDAARQANAEAVAAVRQKLEELEAAVAAADPERALLTEQWERLTSLEERYRSLRQLATERERSLTAASHVQFHGERPEEIRERAKRAREEEEALHKDVHEAEDSLTSAIAQREELEGRERQIERDLADLTRADADRRENAARLSGQINAATLQVESLEQEHVRVAGGKAAARQRVAEATEHIARLEEEIVAGSGTDDVLVQEHEEHSRSLAAATSKKDDARRAEQSAREAVASWTATADALELSLQPEDATAWILDHQSGISGLLRDSIVTVGGWESALESALAGAAQGVVSTDVSSAVDALRAAREATAGHIEITIAGGSTRDDSSDSRGRAALAATGLDADAAVCALDVVSVEPSAGAAVADLLAGVILAKDLVTARRLIEAGADLVATVDGDVLTARRAWGGEVSIASTLARQNSYREARDRAVAAQRDLEKAVDTRREAEQAEREAQGVYESTASQMSARNSQLAAASAELGMLRQTLEAANAELERNSKRQDALARELVERRAHADALVERKNATSDDVDNAQALTALADQRVDAHERTRLARGRETEARLRLRTREERLRAATGTSQALERSADQVAERIEREERAAARNAGAAHQAQVIGGLAGRAHSVIQQLRQEISHKRLEAESSRSLHDSQIHEVRAKLDSLMIEGRKLDDDGHNQALLRADLRGRFEHIAARAIDVVGMDAQTLINEYGPHVMVPMIDGEVPYVREAQEKRLAKAERDLARLGRINPLALEEHAALEERQKYLSGQLADLKKSRDDLLQLIRDLDFQLETVLQSALEDVSGAFKTVFERLFPGGEGQLVLTDPTSPLTTGIEIEARPAGKRVKRLSLLSGGERSLTAIAFLVAIFMARPSPFYVMDEVEAALDDVNLSRLLNIFRDLQESSQLLVVTHQKRTMEIADTLYGITMQEDGVTTVVSQRMSDIAPE